MLSLFGGIHIHSVLAKYAGTAVDHEEIVAVFDAQSGRGHLVFDTGHLHEIEEVVSSCAEYAGTELGEEEEEWREDIEDIPTGWCFREKVSTVK